MRRLLLLAPLALAACASEAPPKGAIDIQRPEVGRVRVHAEAMPAPEPLAVAPPPPEEQLEPEQVEAALLELLSTHGPGELPDRAWRLPGADELVPRWARAHESMAVRGSAWSLMAGRPEHEPAVLALLLDAEQPRFLREAVIQGSSSAELERSEPLRAGLLAVLVGDELPLAFLAASKLGPLPSMAEPLAKLVAAGELPPPVSAALRRAMEASEPR